MECCGNKQLLQTYTLNIGDTDMLLQSKAVYTRSLDNIIP